MNERMFPVLPILVLYMLLFIHYFAMICEICVFAFSFMMDLTEDVFWLNLGQETHLCQLDAWREPHAYD